MNKSMTFDRETRSSSVPCSLVKDFVRHSGSRPLPSANAPRTMPVAIKGAQRSVQA